MFNFLSKLFSNKTSPVDDEFSLKNNISEKNKNNEDILKGYRLTVTMQPFVPLNILERHGERCNKIPEIDKKLPERYALWLPEIDDRFSFLNKYQTIWT